MGKKKNARDSHKTLVIHSAPSIASIDAKLRDSCSIKMHSNKTPQLENRLYYAGSVAGSEYGRKTPQKRRALTPGPSGQKKTLRNVNLQKGTQRFV